MNVRSSRKEKLRAQIWDVNGLIYSLLSLSHLSVITGYPLLLNVITEVRFSTATGHYAQSSAYFMMSLLACNHPTQWQPTVT